MMSMEGNVYVCTSYHTAGNKRHSISAFKPSFSFVCKISCLSIVMHRQY